MDCILGADWVTEEFLLIAAVLALSSVVQGCVGFASALLAIPLMLASGIALPEAIAIMLVASTTQNLTGFFRLRKHVQFEAVFRPSVIRLAALPAGVLVLWWFDNLDRQHVRQAVGAILLAILLVQLLVRVQPQERLHRAWGWLAFSSSGFLVGLCGMGGPPMAMWVMCHRWSPEKSRAFLFAAYLSTMAPQLLLLLACFGTETTRAAFMGLLLVPIVLLATAVGLRIGGALSDVRLRTATFVILLLVAVGSILQPLISQDSTTQRPVTAVTLDGAMPAADHALLVAAE
jgi:uncharacterized membrane protein YfcA